MITVVNKYKHKPTDNDIYIGRGSALGNPFTSIQDRKTKAEHVCQSREESIESFRKYLNVKIKNKDKYICLALNEIYLQAKNGNVNLVCYCKPKACHGDIIKELIESKLKANGKFHSCPACKSAFDGVECGECGFDASEIDIY